MAYRKNGVLYPSKEYYLAKQKLKTAGVTPTTESMKKAMGETPTAPTAPTTRDEKIKSISSQIGETRKKITSLQDVLKTATTAGYGIGTGKDIPKDILSGAISAEDLTEPVIEPIIPEEVPVEEGYSAIMGAGGVGTMMQAIQDQYEKDRKQYEDSKGIIQKYLDKRKSSEAILAEQQEKWGISESFQQIKDITALTLPLQQQIADITIQETAEIDRASQMGMSEGWLRRKETEIHNKYNKLKAPIATQLNAYAAQAQTLQGNLGMANQFANQAVQAATYDQEFEYNTIKAFMDLNNDFLQSLKADQRFYFTNALDIAKSNFDLARSDKAQVMSWSLQYPEVGITLNDSKEQAFNKINFGQQVAIPSQEAAIIGLVNQGITDPAKIYDYINYDEQGKPHPGMPVSMEQINSVLSGVQPGEAEDITVEQYKSGFLADKAEGMTYEDAIQDYGTVLSLDYIDRIYRKGKYSLEDIKIKEAEEGMEEQEQLKKDIAEWDAKYEAGEVHKIETDDGKYTIIKYTKPSWLPKGMEKVLFTYNIKK